MANQPTITINLREFPLDLHRHAKSKAALEGITLKQLIIRAVEQYVEPKPKRGK